MKCGGRLLGRCRADDAAEPQVGGCRVDRLGHPGGRAVPPAVVGGAQVRAALHHPSRDRGGVAGVDASLLRSAARVGDAAAGMGGLAVRLVPVGGPFPDVADHVDQAVAVGRVGAHGRGAFVPVLAGVLDRELALPGVGHPAPVRVELVAPGELGPLQAAAAGQLPFGLGRQRLAGPDGVGLDVVPGDLHHRVVGLLPDRAARALWVAPVGPGHIGPPVVVVAKVDPLVRLAEHGGGRDEHVRPGARVVGRVGGPLGHGDVPSLVDEAGELGVGDGVPVDPEPIHRHLVSRRLLRVVMVGAHQERPAGYPDHGGRRGRGRGHRGRCGLVSGRR